jgi:hypothetical protein
VCWAGWELLCGDDGRWRVQAGCITGLWAGPATAHPVGLDGALLLLLLMVVVVLVVLLLGPGAAAARWVGACWL